MPPADATSPLRPADATRLHTYLASFLSPAATEEVTGELGDLHTLPDLIAALALAHQALQRRVDVAAELEVAVLVEDVGLDAAEAAGVLGVPVETVRTICEAQGIDVPVGVAPGAGTTAPPATPPTTAPQAESPPAPPPAPGPEAEPDAAPAGSAMARDEPLDDTAAEAPGRSGDGVGSGRQRPRRRLVGMLVGLALSVAAVVALALALEGPSPPAAGCEPTPSSPVCTTDVRVTDVIDASGSPGADRSRFELGETVKVWFAFETLGERTSHEVDYVWYREGQPLYADSFVLPVVDRVNLSLASPFAQVPGTYRVRISNGDDVLVDETFTIG